MTGNAQLCIDCANAYYDMGKYANLLDKQAQMQSILSICDAFYGFPAIVNLALSCELYLKALLMNSSNGKIYIGHELDKLFYKLNEKTQKLLSSNFSNRCKYPVTLEETLKIHSKVFIEWRYTFESDKNDVVAYPDNLQIATQIIGEEAKTNLDLWG